jgi:hypothetical protein
VGVVKDVSFANIIATGATKNCGIMLLGHVGHPLQNISLANITVRNAGGGDAKLANREVPERAHDYPQAAWWGDMPAYGLYARHVRALNVANVCLQTDAADFRHALVLDDVENATLDGLRSMPASGTNVLLRLSQSRDVLIRGMQPRSVSGAFLKVEGDNSAAIGMVGNDFSGVARVVELGDGVRAGALREAGNVKP